MCTTGTPGRSSLMFLKDIGGHWPRFLSATASLGHAIAEQLGFADQGGLCPGPGRDPDRWRGGDGEVQQPLVERIPASVSTGRRQVPPVSGIPAGSPGARRTRRRARPARRASDKLLELFGRRVLRTARLIGQVRQWKLERRARGAPVASSWARNSSTGKPLQLPVQLLHRDETRARWQQGARGIDAVLFEAVLRFRPRSVPAASW